MTREDFDAFLRGVMAANEEPNQKWGIRSSIERLREIGFTDDEIEGARDAEGWITMDGLFEYWRSRHHYDPDTDKETPA